jgi:Mg-chelatase subunit ChlD
MGSYEGSSDWDDYPTRSDTSRFRPAPSATAPKELQQPADDETIELAEHSTKPINLILAFDTTGSMRAYIQNVREKIDYLCKGLFKLMDIRIGLIGVGDHCDGEWMLQPYAPTASLKKLQKAVHDIRGTCGGDYPEAFECLFKDLNEHKRWKYDVPTVLVLITDSVPHGLSGEGDAGCPDNVDAREELAKLMPKLKSFYLINCGNHAAAIEIQKTLVASDNYFLQLENFWRLTNLVMAVCMDEVGELDFFMDLLEKQRGKDRRKEVLAIMGR